MAFIINVNSSNDYWTERTCSDMFNGLTSPFISCYFSVSPSWLRAIQPHLLSYLHQSNKICLSTPSPAGASPAARTATPRRCCPKPNPLIVKSRSCFSCSNAWRTRTTPRQVSNLFYHTCPHKHANLALLSRSTSLLLARLLAWIALPSPTSSMTSPWKWRLWSPMMATPLVTTRHPMHVVATSPMMTRLLVIPTYRHRCRLGFCSDQGTRALPCWQAILYFLWALNILNLLACVC